jgi:tetratricopeptide (TPR) repeat protein
MLLAWDPGQDGTFERVGSASVIIAIIDDAFLTSHEDLAANFVAGFDFANNDANPMPDNPGEQHGTLVAGAAGAIGNNGTGVAGTAWGAKLMPLKFDFDTAGHLAALEFARGEPAEALRLLHEVHAACVAELGADHAETLEASVALGGALVHEQETEAGAAMLVAALDGATRILGERHPLTLAAVNNLGLSYQRRGDFDRAEPLLKRAVEIGSTTSGPRHAHTLQARANLGLLQRNRGDSTGAEENLRECWTATCEALGPRSLDSATYELYVAYVDHDAGRFDEAEAHFENVIDIRREALGDDHPETTLGRNRLGTFLLARGRLDEADAVLTKALTDGRARLPQGHYTVIQTYETLLMVREDQGRTKERAQLEHDLAEWTTATHR